MQLDSTQAIHALLVALNDREPKVRTAAGEALRSMGVDRIIHTIDVEPDAQEGDAAVSSALNESIRSPYPQVIDLISTVSLILF